MKYILTTILLITALTVDAQRVHIVDRKEEANKIVYKTKYFSEANLVICRTYDIQDTSKKYHWFFVDSKLRADWIIYYTNDPSEADHIVFFTNRKGLLGSYYAHSKVDPIIPPTRAFTITPQK